MPKPSSTGVVNNRNQSSKTPAIVGGQSPPPSVLPSCPTFLTLGEHRCGRWSRRAHHHPDRRVLRLSTHPQEQKRKSAIRIPRNTHQSLENTTQLTQTSAEWLSWAHLRIELSYTTIRKYSIEVFKWSEEGRLNIGNPQNPDDPRTFPPPISTGQPPAKPPVTPATPPSRRRSTLS